MTEFNYASYKDNLNSFWTQLKSILTFHGIETVEDFENSIVRIFNSQFVELFQQTVLYCNKLSEQDNNLGFSKIWFNAAAAICHYVIYSGMFRSLYEKNLITSQQILHDFIDFDYNSNVYLLKCKNEYYELKLNILQALFERELKKFVTNKNSVFRAIKSIKAPDRIIYSKHSNTSKKEPLVFDIPSIEENKFLNEILEKIYFYKILYFNTFLDKPLSGYQFRSVSTHLLANLENEKISFSHPSDFNDPFDTTIQELQDFMPDDIRQTNKTLPVQLGNALKKKMFVTCLSESIGNTAYLNELMWSHYADSHKGICIKYNIPKLKFPDVFSHVENISKSAMIHSISYELTSKDLFQPNIGKRQPETVFYKHKCWEYENEVRILYIDKNTVNDSHVSIKFPNCIEEVYFGYKCSAEDKQLVMKCLSDKKTHDGQLVKFFDMILQKTKTGSELKAVPVE